MAEKVSKEAKGAKSSEHQQSISVPKRSLDTPEYEAYDQSKGGSPKGLSAARFNPLALRFKSLSHSSQEGRDQIRSQARKYEKIARVNLWRVKNRGRGDTAVNGMIFAARQLLNVSRRALEKPITPKLVYEFRYAKSEFEKAKKMSVAKATKLPHSYYKDNIRRKREEEEDRVIPVIHDDDDYTQIDKGKTKSK